MSIISNMGNTITNFRHIQQNNKIKTVFGSSSSESKTIANSAIGPTNSNSKQIVIALYDFEGSDEEDVSFFEGDRLEIIGTTEGAWLKAVNLQTKKYGSIPGNYVAPERSIQSEDEEEIYIDPKNFNLKQKLQAVHLETKKFRSIPENYVAPGNYIASERSIQREDEAETTASSENKPAHFSRNQIVIALYDFKGTEEDVSFTKGDRMEITDDSEGDWLKVVHLQTKKRGYIPRNYIAPEKSIQIEDWFFENISRREAEELLLDRENPAGTFLIRPSEYNANCYSISIKDWSTTQNFNIKHYKIKPLPGDGFSISHDAHFISLKDLVDYHSQFARGLCHVLVQACKRPPPRILDLSHAYQVNWEIRRDEITLFNRLGTGNFGEVYYGKWKGFIEIAVKTMKKGTMSTEAFLEEAAIMKKIRHEKLVTLYGVCTENEPIYIVQEYMCNGCLLDYLRKDEGYELKFDNLMYIAYQICCGMSYLERQKLMHRDLAARNVLIGKNHTAKICDFGLARVIVDTVYFSIHGKRFPVKWSAPEAIVQRKFTIKSDIWSYGILLMEIFTYGQEPYADMSNYEVIDQLVTGYRMPKPNDMVTDSLYEIMLSCWNAEPEKRPTFEFLKQYFERYQTSSESQYKIWSIQKTR